MRFSRGTRTICEGCECRKKWQCPTVVFYAAKDRQTIAGVRKRRQLLAGVVFSSAGISKNLKFLANVSRIPGRVLPVICSQTCLKSFVICAGPTQDVRDVRKIFVNPQPDHDNLQNVSRNQRSSPDYFSTFLRTFCVRLETFSRLNVWCIFGGKSTPRDVTSDLYKAHDRGVLTSFGLNAR